MLNGNLFITVVGSVVALIVIFLLSLSFLLQEGTCRFGVGYLWRTQKARRLRWYPYQSTYEHQPTYFLEYAPIAC